MDNSAWQELARIAADREAELEHAQSIADALRAELAHVRGEPSPSEDERGVLNQLALLQEERASPGSATAALEPAQASTAASSPQAVHLPAQPALATAEPHDAAAGASNGSVAGSPSRPDGMAEPSAASAAEKPADDASESGAWTEAAVPELVWHMCAEHEAATEALRSAS